MLKDDEQDEEVLAFVPRLFRWHGPKAKTFLFGSVQGTLVITTRRLLFVTKGGSGVMSQFDVRGGEFIVGMRLADVDLSQAAVPDSFSILLEDIERFEVLRRWDFAYYLTLQAIDEHGQQVCCALMRKFGLTAGDLRDLVATALGQGSNKA